MSETTRRAVLAGAVGAGAAAAMAACGGGGSDSGSGGNTPTQNPPEAAAPSAPASTAPTGSTAPAANGLARTSEIPVGGGKVFDSAKVVVTQPAAGQFKAFSAVCTHMGCTVGSVANGVIMCPCHGSRYSIQDGSVKGGPAPTALPAKRVTVTGDEIVVS